MSDFNFKLLVAIAQVKGLQVLVRTDVVGWFIHVYDRNDGSVYKAYGSNLELLVDLATTKLVADAVAV